MECCPDSGIGAAQPLATRMPHHAANSGQRSLRRIAGIPGDWVTLVQAILESPQETVTPWTRPSRSGRVGRAQLIAAQAGLLGVAGAVYALPPGWIMPAVIAVGGAVLAVVGRYRGRWWYEVAGAVMQLRRRQALAYAVTPDPAAGQEWGELSRVSPGLTIGHVEHRNMRIGVGLDDQGWFAGIELTAPDGLTETGGAELRLGSLVRLAGPLSTLQLLVRGAFFSGTDPRSPCAESYRELRTMLAVPAERQAWLVVRLAPGDAVDVAADRVGEVNGVHATLSAALVRIGEELRSRRIPHHVLDGPGLRQALVSAYGAFDGAPVHGSHQPGESWRRWQGSRAAHLCYGVASWSSQTAPAVIDALSQGPSALATSAAVTVGALRRPDRDDGPLATRVLVRVVTSPPLEGECRRQLRAIAQHLGARLVRLDGEHAPSVYATMPTASQYGWGRPW